ncbi:MAG: methyltransferase [Euryarchaeota archaeon]|nr:methyltransferase [Euryarchaeota archaeon]
MTSHPVNQIFSFNGLSIEFHGSVYEPAEDTFQLLEAIKITPKETVLEIGTGCGIIALDLARQGCSVVCTDINPYAIELTHRNIERNRHLLKGHIDVRLGDLFSPVQKDERFSVMVFNPPYLPTKKKDRIGGDGWFDVATDGGLTGLSVTKRFIQELPRYLSSDGRAYFVFSSLSDRDILNQYLKKINAQAEVVLSRCFHDELIDIYRITL